MNRIKHAYLIKSPFSFWQVLDSEKRKHVENEINYFQIIHFWTQIKIIRLRWNKWLWITLGKYFYIDIAANHCVFIIKFLNNQTLSVELLKACEVLIFKRIFQIIHSIFLYIVLKDTIFSLKNILELQCLIFMVFVMIMAKSKWIFTGDWHSDIKEFLLDCGYVLNLNLMKKYRLFALLRKTQVNIE